MSEATHGSLGSSLQYLKVVCVVGSESKEWRDFEKDDLQLEARKDVEGVECRDCWGPPQRLLQFGWQV